MLRGYLGQSGHQFSLTPWVPIHQGGGNFQSLSTSQPCITDCAVCVFFVRLRCHDAERYEPSLEEKVARSSRLCTFQSRDRLQ